MSFTVDVPAKPKDFEENLYQYAPLCSYAVDVELVSVRTFERNPHAINDAVVVDELDMAATHM